VARSRGQRCGNIELAGYLVNVAGPVPLVLDLHITHDRFGSRSDPGLNGHLHYPYDLDRSLNETVVDKIRQYRAYYNNRPSNTISFIPVIVISSGCLHSEFVWLLFWQVHRETDRFFCSFRSSACAIWPWPVPLPPRGVLLTDQIESGQHHHQGWSIVDNS
jgi:hypothetical protein